MSLRIEQVRAHDMRFPLAPGEGSDAVHRDPVYSYAAAELTTNGADRGVGLAFTLGGGNDLVCRAVKLLGSALVGEEIETLMRSFGEMSRRLADHPQLRWLGPHKGVVHLALASLANACFDLWAKSRGEPLWRLLLSLTPDELVSTLDMSYLEDALTREEAVEMLTGAEPSRPDRMEVLQQGYPGYDTSIGWIGFSDSEIRERVAEALERGFQAVKLKVGAGTEQDIRRAYLVREIAGEDRLVMLDANQAWTLPQAVEMCGELAGMRPYWIEEPTHPDDVAAHRSLVEAIHPMRVAAGEHLPHRVAFKNFLQLGAFHFNQVDCVRVAGVGEFIAVSLMSKKFGVPVVPHVGDMGQIHQHLTLFNHIAVGHERLFLEHIPHLREHFERPAQIAGGVYLTPEAPGSSSDLKAMPR